MNASRPLGSPAGIPCRLTILALDSVVGIVALPILWLMEGLALQFLPLDSTYWYVSVGNALLESTCLLWLAVVVALARRGQTPASVVIRRRWVDVTGKPASWGPLGSLSFWIGAAPALFASLLFGEDLCLAGPEWSWGGWPPPFENYGPGIAAACLMILGIALPPYLRFRRQTAYVGRVTA